MEELYWYCNQGLCPSHGKGEYTDNRGNHINGLEGFWGYLKRKLFSEGGIRKERLPLYLAEYVWRYNHRNFTIKQQLDNLLNILYLSYSGRNKTLPILKF